MTKPQPTHDEVIAWLDKEIAKRKRIYEGLACGCEATGFVFGGTFCKSCFDQIAKPIREQIAREIEAECEQGGAMACGISGNYQCSCSGAVAIARGENRAG